MIVRTLNFCAKIKKEKKKEKKQEKRRAHSCEHILSVSHPSHSVRNSTCVVSGDPFCHFSHPTDSTRNYSPWFPTRRWRFCLVPSPQLIISPRGPFSDDHDSVRFSSNWGFQYAAPLPPRVNSMWFFRSPNKNVLSVFHPKN